MLQTPKPATTAMTQNRLPAVLFFLFSHVCFLVPGFAQGIAGVDKIICTGGTVQIGTPSPACNGCCWKWEPTTGLSDASAPTPLVSALASTTEYTLVATHPDGSTTTDKVLVYVCTIDLDTYKPKFIDGSEPKLAETLETPTGVQTFVNLDSDDNDAEFDNVDAEITGGDDEFIKLEITIEFIGAAGFPPPASSPLIRLKHASGSDAAAIRLWKSNDKRLGEYFPDEPYELPNTGGNTHSGFLWVEGIAAHTEQRATRLYADYGGGSACASSELAITVIGVESISWQGIENGYTGDGKNNSPGLDMHISENGYPPHARVFPEAKFGTVKPTDDAKDKVGLNVTLSVKPVENIPVYIRLFDADDPSNAYTTIDLNDGPTSGSGNYEGATGLTYDEHNDNRGTAGGKKFGILQSTSGLSTINPALGIYKYEKDDKEFVLHMPLSHYPGDNYTAAVYADLDFMNKLRNLDKYDNQNTVFESTDCGAACPPVEASLMAPTLTVWRTLHIEYDRMQNPDWSKNLLIDGYFSDFDVAGGGASIKQTAKISSIWDDPPDPLPVGWNANQILLDASTGKGRFSDGGIRIGAPSVELCDHAAGPCIESNDANSVTLAGTMDLTDGGKLKAVLSKKLTPDSPPLTIVDIQKIAGPDFIVTISAPMDLTAYNNGDVVISGGKKCTGCVQTSGPGNTNQFTIKNTAGKSNLVVPITIMDDDDIPWGGTSTLIQPLTFSATKIAFEEVYIDAVNDGGGNLMNNKGNIRFSRNVNDASKSDKYSKEDIGYYNKDRESFDWEKDDYWCVYVLSAWQYITSKDTDPESEVSSLGVTNSTVLDCSLAQGGHISIMFHEAVADSNTDIEISCIHEIGHQFGLTHGKGPGDKGACASCVIYSCILKKMGIMQSSTPLPSYFIPYHKHIIRSRSKSPGLK